MIDIIIYISMFFIGIFFGSFFTLAVYRIPLGQDIVHTHSYCPNCKHKLGFLDLFPVFSYIFLGGKCRYCKQKIRPRYLILEVLSGLVFVLFAMSFNLNGYFVEFSKIISIVFGVLYLVSMFIIAGIDKERCQIQKSVIVYGIVISLMQAIYLWKVECVDISNFVIALTMLIVLMWGHSTLIKEVKFKNSVWNYATQVVILALYMLIATGKLVTMPTLMSTLIALIIYVIIEAIHNKNKEQKKTTKVVKKSKDDKLEEEKDKNAIPVGFMLCVLNVVCILIYNFLWNYII